MSDRRADIQAISRNSTPLALHFGPALTPWKEMASAAQHAFLWEVRLRGVPLPELFALTVEEVHNLFGEETSLARPPAAARVVGPGYLVPRQPGYALSGGEAERLKIARELSQRRGEESLCILDEPTVGQHMEESCA